MGQYVTTKDNIDYAVVSNSLDNQIKDLNDRREKQRSQMKMMSEAIAQKRKAGDTRQYQYTVDKFGGVKATDESESYLDFFKTKDVDLESKQGGTKTTLNKIDNSADKLKEEYNENYNEPTTSLTDLSKKVIKPESKPEPETETKPEVKDSDVDKKKVPKLKTDEELRTIYESHAQERRKQGDKPVSYEEYRDKYHEGAKYILDNLKKLDGDGTTKTTDTQEKEQPKSNSEQPTDDNGLTLGRMLNVGRKLAGKDGSYSAQMNEGSTSDSQATGDMWQEDTESTMAFGGNVVKSDPNELMANAMMSHSNSAWGHETGAEAWKTLANKAYAETEAYKQAQVTRNTSQKLIEGKKYQYSTSSSGDSYGMSINPLDPNSTTLGNAKPRTTKIFPSDNPHDSSEVKETTQMFNNQPTAVWHLDAITNTQEAIYSEKLKALNWQTDGNGNWSHKDDPSYHFKIVNGRVIGAIPSTHALHLGFKTSPGI
jgi:hypothetical protein